MYFYNNCNCNNHKNIVDEKNYLNNYERKTCCIKKTEETYCCFPSYYNEEIDDCKEDANKGNYNYPCFEGTFTLYPRTSNCNKKRDEHQKEKSCDKEYNKNYNNKCCFCNLFNCHHW